jgi:hypothetical protein
MARLDPQGILRRRPFADVVPLRRVNPLAGEEAHSGRSFLAEAEDGRLFKLRVCESRARARSIEAHMRALPDFFAPFVAREGALLLIDWLDGEQLADRKQLRPFAAQLGRAYARIHQRGAPRGVLGWLGSRAIAFRIRLQFARHLAALRRVDRELEAGLARLARGWRRRYGVPVALELRDAHKANFVIDRDGDLRYVDEDGLMYAMRGMGLGKLLADPGSRPGSPKRTREWYQFCEGYTQLADGRFLTPEYCAYARLLELVRSVEFKLRRGRRLHKVEDELAELRELLGPEVKRPPHPADVQVESKRETRPRESDQPS